MILWTIQTKEAYEKGVKVGSIKASPDEHLLLFKGTFKKYYKWMADQMYKRIGKPEGNIKYPVWLWYQWEGKRKRPDMRTFARGWGNPGTEIVLLTVDIPDEKVLLSDFDNWHYILNDIPVLSSDENEDTYTNKTKVESWERIFDIECSFDKTEHKHLSTQACVWEIPMECITKVEHFLCR